MPGAPIERPPSCSTQLGLADYIDAYPAEISAGEQRRAVIARALINAPSLLLADEPTSDLDEETEREIMEQFRAVNRERAMTLIMVTHNLRLAEQTDRVVHIADGRLGCVTSADHNRLLIDKLSDTEKDELIVRLWRDLQEARTRYRDLEERLARLEHEAASGGASPLLAQTSGGERSLPRNAQAIPRSGWGAASGSCGPAFCSARF